jgi:hypothetical protein
VDVIRRRAFVAVIPVALALGACGGDDSNDNASPASGGNAQSGTGTTGVTGSSGASGVTAAIGPTGATGKRGQRKSSKAASGSAGGSGSTRVPAGPGTPSSNSSGGTKGKKKSRVKYRGDVLYSYRLAKVFCKYNTADYLASVYHMTTTNPRQVARQYALHAYKPNMRKAAFEGCLLSYRQAAKKKKH